VLWVLVGLGAIWVLIGFRSVDYSRFGMFLLKWLLSLVLSWFTWCVLGLVRKDGVHYGATYNEWGGFICGICMTSITCAGC
jgi:hypothetical protein